MPFFELLLKTQMKLFNFIHFRTIDLNDYGLMLWRMNSIPNKAHS
jgi:hypothetical protein